MKESRTFITICTTVSRWWNGDYYERDRAI